MDKRLYAVVAVGVLCCGAAPATDCQKLPMQLRFECGRSEGTAAAPTITKARPYSATTTNWDFTSGATTKSNNITVIGIGAEPGATVSVYLDDGGSTTGTGTADGSGNWSYNLSGLSDASHSVTATQTTGSGTSPASSAFTFTVAALITSFTNVQNEAITVGGKNAWNETANTSYAIERLDTHTLRYEIDSGDRSTADVANGEQCDRSLSDFSAAEPIANGTEVRFTAEFFLESGNPHPTGDRYWWLIYENHGPIGSPPWGLYFSGEKMQMQVRYNAPDGGAVTELAPWTDMTNIVRGVWHTIEVRGKQGQSGTGYLQVWIDGPQVLNYTGSIGYGAASWVEVGTYRSNLWTDPVAIRWRNILISP
jgi:hypothetical protein